MNDHAEREAAIFNEARGLPRPSRTAYLTCVCADDPALRERVEDLLRGLEAAEGFLETPALLVERPEPEPRPTVVIDSENQAFQKVQLWDLRLVRQELAQMNLDWDLPPYPPPAEDSQTPVSLQIDGESTP